MKVEQAIAGVKLLFLDTAPVIYYLEGHPTFSPSIRSIFEKVSNGDLQLVSSPITLAECSSIPCVQQRPELKQDLADVLALNRHGIFRITDEVVLIEAVKMRVKYGLKLADAIQVATAIVCNCDGFLTNDLELSKVTEIRSIVVSELEL
jgi:predicted nucleic acid-binding protein